MMEISASNQRTSSVQYFSAGTPMLQLRVLHGVRLATLSRNKWLRDLSDTIEVLKCMKGGWTSRLIRLYSILVIQICSFCLLLISKSA
ncbi:hypothetical protein DM860_015501 [Cuscuta australis]|uniref:Uncharacterized protein n=1 Tax=Cuscuta australis TaxID=267555 RepID=A0A328DGY7_9ASTE|nr:hypothetical protein DM860_015501 [Cuscuta australis]